MRVAPLYRTVDFYQTLGQRVNMALPAGTRVGVIAPAVSEILFYGNRKGWRLDPGVLVPGGLSSLGPDLGVRYVLIADPWLTERRDVLTEALHEYRRVPVGPYALLLDLKQPGYSMPFEMAWDTGHVVQEPFLSAWRMLGGAAKFGLPLSDALAGPEGQEQYFERGLLRMERGHVERAKVGSLLLEALGRAPQPSDVAAPFLDVWQKSGGEAVLGPALSPAVSMPDGTLIQFFAYGTLEQPPGGTPTLGASGRRLLDARGLTEEQQIIMSAQHARK